MITLASELLARFIDEEKRKLEMVEMPHMPTLGNAYEEITKQGIDKEFVIPKSLNLRVVSGHIEVGGERLKNQIDCMLVEGEGIRYGLTNQYFYKIEQVLCIFEVKKTLTKYDYIDAIDHLGDIRKKFAADFENKLKDKTFEPKISLAGKAYAQITGKIAPNKYRDINNLTKFDALLFYTLVQEQNAPLSIVHGYGGYRTEQGLRAAFLDIIEERYNTSNLGMGVPNMPALVISNDFCIIKGNGQPYIAIQNGKSWAALLSTRHNPVRILLEIIWSKIASHFRVEMPYGPDLDIEKVIPVLFAEPGELNGQYGWKYRCVDIKEKNLVRDELASWEPSKIGPAEMSAINLMGFNGGYLELKPSLNDYLKKEFNKTQTEVIGNLIQTQIFAMEGQCLRPVSNHTYVITNEDESGYVGNEKNRFDGWCKKNSVHPYYMNIIFLE
jgi:hypothetical protein